MYAARLAGVTISISRTTAVLNVAYQSGDSEWVTKWDAAENTQVEAVKGGRSGAMKRAAVQWGVVGICITKVFARKYPVTETRVGTGPKLKDGTSLQLPPSLPNWAMPASGNQPSPENTNQKSPSVDCRQILKDFSDYAATGN